MEHRFVNGSPGVDSKTKTPGTGMLLFCMLFIVAGTGLSQSTFYVDASRPDDSGDGTSWATAKQTIQAGVDLAVAGDVVLVQTGLYNKGEAVNPAYPEMTNRVYLVGGISLMGVSTNPADTVIMGEEAPGGGCGDGAIRAVYLAGGPFLANFTITNGHTRTAGDVVYEQHGGGVWTAGLCMVSNCLITGNACNSRGGGMYRGVMIDCTVIGNHTASKGGGISETKVYNSLIHSNTSASSGGGSYNGSMTNCIIEYNTASFGGGAEGGTYELCVFSAY